MAALFRRRKNGKLVGNWFVTVAGQDINLKTKDAEEARRRSKMAARGEWPPLDAAAAAAAAAADPTVEQDPALPPAVETGGGSVGGEPQPEMPPRDPLPPTAGTTEAPADPAAAFSAAASEVAGERAAEVAGEAQVSERAKVDAKLAAIMAEIGAGPDGGDVLGTACNILAGFLLAAERKTIEWGGDSMLRKSKRKLIPGEPPGIAQKALAAGLHGYAVEWFPNFAERLTPGWAIVLGLGVGGAGMAFGGKVIELPPKEGAPATAAPVNAQQPSVHAPA